MLLELLDLLAQLGRAAPSCSFNLSSELIALVLQPRQFLLELRTIPIELQKPLVLGLRCEAAGSAA